MDILSEHIALFGGTFDPVHLGHIHMATAAQKCFGLGSVRFIPCHLSPHKTERPPTAASHRLAMLRLATAALPWATVDPRELDRKGPSYSYETASDIAAECPAARLWWIMGSDQWAALDRWAKPDLLAKLLDFIVFHRGETPAPRPGFRLHPVRDEHPASATTIRKALSDGNPHPPWLHPETLTYIRKHGLYG